MARYRGQSRILLAVDCVILGFDNSELKVLLVRRAIEPDRQKWSLIGGFMEQAETLDDAAKRILKKAIGSQHVYIECLKPFSDPKRDPAERTVSIVYFSLINVGDFSQQINHLYKAEWFPLNEIPEVVFDHRFMIDSAFEQVRYNAARHPILFKLLPERFTMPQLQVVFESVYGKIFDDRNFKRKFLSSGLLIKQKEKNKATSKKGAFFYELDKAYYLAQLYSFQNIIPHLKKP